MGGLSLGLSTPRLIDVAPGEIDSADIVQRVDAYLAAGDLSENRGSLVRGAEHRASPVDELSSSRTGPASTLNIEPFLGLREMRAGNTLNLNNADPYLGPVVGRLRDDIATVLRAHVQTNVYLSMGDAPGFGAHWDDHDVLVVPVHGPKYWEVESPHELGSLKDITAPGGTGNAVWSGVLRPGQALAIPRGWPHRVHGFEGELTVHLTVSIRRPTALDLIAHIDACRFDSDSGFEFDDSDFEHGLGSWASVLSARSSSGPIAAAAADQADYADHELSIEMVGGPVFLPSRCNSDQLVLSGNNRTFTVRRADAKALASALEAEWFTVDQLVSEGATSRKAALAMVRTLGEAGVIRLRPLMAAS